jgi:hypothetical protein
MKSIRQNQKIKIVFEFPFQEHLFAIQDEEAAGEESVLIPNILLVFQSLSRFAKDADGSFAVKIRYSSTIS